MASIDPPSKPVSLALIHICFRDWCQEQLVRAMMFPEDYILYFQITRNFFDRVTPYDEFRHQMEGLLQNPDYAPLRVYWDLYHSWIFGEVQMANHPQFSDPIKLCRKLNLIPAFAFIFFGYPALWNHVPRRSRQQAAKMAAEWAAQGAAQGAAEEVAEEVAEEAAQEAAQGAAQRAAEEVAQEAAQKVAQEAYESGLEGQLRGRASIIREKTSREKSNLPIASDMQ